MKKIGKYILNAFMSAWDAASLAWKVIATVLFTVGIIIMGGVFLSLPVYGYYLTFIGSAIFFAMKHEFHRVFVIAVLVLYGPFIALMSYFTIWQQMPIASIIQGAICWGILILVFTSGYWLGLSKPRVDNTVPQQ